MHPGLTDLGDTFYTGSCTDVNADGVPKLQHYQDTYMSHCTQIGSKKGHLQLYKSALKSLICMTRTSFNTINY